MGLFEIAKKTPAAATEYRVAFPFKGTERGYNVVEQEMVPMLDADDNPVLNKEGEPIERPRFKADDVELWLKVSAIPQQQFTEARTNVKIDCDRVKVDTKGEYASELMEAEKARLVLEHVEGWEHCPKEDGAEPLEFDKELLVTLVESAKESVTSENFNRLLNLSHTWSVLEESQKALSAKQAEQDPKKNGVLTSAKGSANLAFAE